MGTWAFPGTREKAERLVAVLERPLPAAEAVGLVHDLVGEDRLHASLGETAAEYPDMDVRGAVAETVALWAVSVLDPAAEDVKRTVGQWLKPWEPGTAERVLEAALAAMEETRSYATWPLAQWLEANRPPLRYKDRPGPR